MKITDALRLRVQKIDHGRSRANIIVGMHATEGSDILLSGNCLSAIEVREQADRVIRQLEDIKSKADSVDWIGLTLKKGV